MTATSVGGIAVIADEPAESPISTPGKPVFYKQIRRLLLADDTEVFGCLHCDYTADSVGRIRPHLKAHVEPKPKAARKPSASELSLSQLLAKLADLEKVTAERDDWRRRALNAERKLSAMRKALKP